MMVPFNPAALGSTLIVNATGATAAVELDPGCSQFCFYNTSATAVVYIEVTNLDAGATARGAVIPASGVRGSFPVPPGAQIRLTLGTTRKAISAIASAADGNLIVSAGNGN